MSASCTPYVREVAEEARVALRVGHRLKLREIELRGIGPQLLEAVELPLLGLEHVDHHVGEVEQYPLALALALPADRLHAALHTQHILDLVGDGGHLPVAVAGHDDEVRGDHKRLGDIEHDRVDGLLRCGG